MLSENIKKDAKILSEIFKIKNNFKFYNNTYKVLSILSLFYSILSSIFLLINHEVISISLILFLFTIGLILHFFVFFVLNFIIGISINYIIKRKYIKKNMSCLGIFTVDYIVSEKKLKKTEKLYNELSKEGKNYIINISSKAKESENIKEIEKDCLYIEINNMNIKDFINYWNSYFQKDIKNINIEIEDFIKRKIQQILIKINEEDFNKYKNEIIKITETLKSKKEQLVIFKEIEKLKDKYDEEIIIDKINKIKNKVNNNLEEKTNNKILKSI